MSTKKWQVANFVASELKNRVKKVIRERCDGITRQFSDETGIAVSTINSWNDENIPSGRHLDAIRRAFGVNLHWLVAGVGYPYIEDAADSGVSADKSGFWGSTKREVGGGVEHVVTEFIPPGQRQALPPPDLGQAVNMLSTVLGSGDDVITHALMANLIAFSRATEQNKAHVERIRNLEAKCSDLMERLEAVEKRLGQPAPQQPGGAGALKKSGVA